MTSARTTEYDGTTDELDINPVYTFLLLFVTPYVLFFLMLMLITGQSDIELLYLSVMNESNTTILKAWVIGSFVLSITGTLFFSGYRTTDYIVRRLQKNANPAQSGSVLPVEPTHFVIEEVHHGDAPDSHDESDPSPERYARLDSVIGDTKK